MKVEIHVKGQRGIAWTEWFSELTAQPLNGDETLLSGELPDQSALLGLLLRLHNLNLTLICVRRVAGTIQA